MAEIVGYDKADDRRDGLTSENDKAIAEAIAARDEFLRKNPELRAFQDEIDGILGKVIDSENRMAVLGLLIEGRAYQLKNAVSRLRTAVVGSGVLPDELKDEDEGRQPDNGWRKRLH